MVPDLEVLECASFFVLFYFKMSMREVLTVP